MTIPWHFPHDAYSSTLALANGAFRVPQIKSNLNFEFNETVVAQRQIE